MLTEEEIDLIFELNSKNGPLEMSVNLQEQSVQIGDRFTAHFEIDQFRKDCLLNGIDDIGSTLSHLDHIKDFEAKRGYPAVD